jgi:Uma2 family endonuclease
MAPATSTKLTYEDYCLLPDDGRRHEIIDGEHYVNPAPNIPHQRISRKIVFTLTQHVEQHDLGEVFYAPCDVVLSAFDVVEPDILFVSKARRHIIGTANIQGAPDLVVEILSPSSRQYDEVFKLKRYDAAGVAEYWIVDPDAETIVVHRRRGANFVIVAFDDLITFPLLPELSLRVADVFDVAD